ncbi:MAG TPA: histidine kinase, partial [Longimicrobium sp.]|nr:histidine kinase [Longimicrobium sp.]
MRTSARPAAAPPPPPPRHDDPRPRRWGVMLAAFWLADAVFLSIQVATRYPEARGWMAVAVGFYDALTWATASLAAYAVGWRLRPWRGLVFPAVVLPLLATGVVLARHFFFWGLDVVVGFPWDAPPPRRFLLLFPNQFLIAVSGVSAGFAVRQALAARERAVAGVALEARLARARLQALQAQIDPGFLFGALDAVSALLRRDAPAADRLLARLGDVLRRALSAPAARPAPLEEELDAVRLAVDLERARRGDAPTAAIDADEAARAFSVPPRLLQPLVESALRRGPSWVRVTARVGPDGLLALAVEDDGTAGAEGDDRAFAEADEGAGALPWAAARVEAGPAPGDGRRVSLRLPAPPPAPVEAETGALARGAASVS